MQISSNRDAKPEGSLRANSFKGLKRGQATVFQFYWSELSCGNGLLSLLKALRACSND
jgi:hypothetical protein